MHCCAQSMVAGLHHDAYFMRTKLKELERTVRHMHPLSFAAEEETQNLGLKNILKSGVIVDSHQPAEPWSPMQKM